MKKLIIVFSTKDEFRMKQLRSCTSREISAEVLRRNTPIAFVPKRKAIICENCSNSIYFNDPDIGNEACYEFDNKMLCEKCFDIEATKVMDVFKKRHFIDLCKR